MRAPRAPISFIVLIVVALAACGDDSSGDGGASGSGGDGGSGGDAGSGGSTGGTAGTGATGGGSGGNFGMLTLAGPDTGVLGTTYTPTIATPIINDVTGAVSWSGPIGRGVTIGFAPDGTPSSAALIFVSPSNVDEVYAYFLTCQITPAECDKIVIDIDGRSATFNDVELPVAPGGAGPVNIATAPVEADGTLTWN